MNSISGSRFTRVSIRQSFEMSIVAEIVTMPFTMSPSVPIDRNKSGRDVNLQKGVPHPRPARPQPQHLHGAPGRPRAGRAGGAAARRPGATAPRAERHIDLETSADTRWEHSSMLIPGLLQTEAYMRYVARAYRPSMTPDHIDQLTDKRLTRQRILDHIDRRFWFVIDEAALCRMANMDGDSTIKREQIKHLIEAVDRSNFEVQAVPFNHGYYPGQEEDYVIFGYGTCPSGTTSAPRPSGRSRPGRSCPVWRGRDCTRLHTCKGTDPR